MSTKRAEGLKIALPADPLGCCAFCEQPRRNKTKGWARVTDGAGTLRGWTCPDCPTYGEPIRRVVSAKGRVRWAWRVTATPDGARKAVQARGTAETLTAAREAVEAARQTILQAGSWSRADVLTVRDLCGRWLDERRKEIGTPGGIREVTVNGYASSLHTLLLVLGDDLAADMTPGRVEDALREIATTGGKWKRGLSHRSTSYALGSLRQAYTHGMREGWVSANPAAAARPPRRQAGTKAPKMLRWSPTQLVKFRDHADTYGEGAPFAAEPWLRAAMRLSLCGLRRSEVLGLDWSRVDLDTGTIKVRASRVKTGRGKGTSLGPVKTDASRRTVKVESIHPGTVSALRELWMVQGRPESGLVVCDAAGEWVHPDTYSDRWRALCGEVGVPVLARIHNIRHSIATALREAGVPENQAAALLGHDVETYRRFYLVTDDDAAADGAAAAGKAFAI